ncbi:MAG: TRAP transporter TatT component family protein [bacterium]|nr:TRAP transporter TatT component family protein [bacterium]
MTVLKVNVTKILVLRSISLIILLGSVLGVSSCSLTKTASNITSKILVRGAPVFEEEADIQTAQTASLATLKTLEAFARDNPANRNYAVLLTKSYGNYAFGFIETEMLRHKYTDSDKYRTEWGRAKLFYARGKDYGLNYLKRKSRFEKSLTQDLLTFQKVLRSYDRDDVDLLFWTAYCWGSWINLSKDDPEAITDLPRVEAMMARVLELKETFFNAGPHLFYGVYYANRPPLLGGSPPKALEHFETAIQLTNSRFLMAHILEAQYYAVQIQDKELFKQLLTVVLEAPADILPSQRLANELAKERAKILLDRINYYF